VSVIVRMSDGTQLKSERAKSWVPQAEAPWIHVYDDNTVLGSFNALEVDGIYLEDEFEEVEDDTD
jgi:hypothetical protein